MVAFEVDGDILGEGALARPLRVGRQQVQQLGGTRLGAAVETPSLRGELAVIVTVLPSVRVRDLRRQLSGLTHGEGVLESSFEGYEPLVGEPPTRRRTTPNPLSRDEYIAHVAGRAVAGAGTSGERVP